MADMRPERTEGDRPELRRRRLGEEEDSPAFNFTPTSFSICCSADTPLPTGVIFEGATV
jgi:hypothetical protein